MTLSVFLAVVGAAALHALWNAVVKQGQDKHTAMLAISLGHIPFALLTLPFVTWPSLASVPWLIASIVVHLAYQLALISSYRLGDFTLVYPVARGSAPALVTLVSLFALQEAFSGFQLLGVGLVVFGLFTLALARDRQGTASLRALVMALATGTCIAGYSLIDGLGAIASGSAVGYWGLSALGTSLALAGWTWFYRGDSLHAFGQTPSLWRSALLGGGASYLAYGLVIWAFTQAPIALVTALRETSIVFALLIGVLVMREKTSPVRIFAALLLSLIHI